MAELCGACGVELPAPRGRPPRNPRKWCSPACQQWARRHPGQRRPVDRTCVECGGPMAGRRASAKRCSDACRAEAARRCMKEKYEREHPRPQDRQCERCGCAMLTQKRSARFCSDECQRLAWRDLHPDYEWNARAKERHRRRLAAKRAARMLAVAKALGEWAPTPLPPLLPRPRPAARPEPVARLDLRGSATAYVRSLCADPCAYCGGPGGQRDHIVPRALAGGTTGTGAVADVPNLTGCCAPCNLAKSNRSLLQFLAALRPLSRSEAA